jgi:two-component system nitrogen regulation sensor histidine kinase NtrY
MKPEKETRPETRKSRRRDRRFLSRLGPFVVAVAILIAIGSFLIFAGLTPLTPTDQNVQYLFYLDGAVALILSLLVAFEAVQLVRAWRAKTAAAGLHIRIVALFAIIAAVPAISMAVVSSVTLDKLFNPAFMRDVRGFIGAHHGRPAGHAITMLGFHTDTPSSCGILELDRSNTVVA